MCFNKVLCTTEFLCFNITVKMLLCNYYWPVFFSKNSFKQTNMKNGQKC